MLLDDDEPQQTPKLSHVKKHNRNTLRTLAGDPELSPPQLLREAAPTPPLAPAGGGDIDRKPLPVSSSNVIPELGSWLYPKVEENPPPWKAYPDDRPRLLVGERLRVLRRKEFIGGRFVYRGEWVCCGGRRDEQCHEYCLCRNVFSADFAIAPGRPLHPSFHHHLVEPNRALYII